MRRELIACRHRQSAVIRNHWAKHIARTDGGWLCFEDDTDFGLWQRQQDKERYRQKH